ncbi:MAG: glutamate synthase subunit beta [Bacteroidaceae bacterium]|nr:glutamate synthase subunit beta [Bacteroidaceae bacterium]
MGNPKAFLTVPRQEAGHRPVYERIKDFAEVEQTLSTHDRKLQASRCMDCGVPFCHWACPLGNKAPEWNDALYQGKWELAYRLLTATNPFPEFTGRICPALCEKACILNHFNDEPTTNREDECAIIEAAFREGYIKPAAYERNGHRVAVIGAGPAGLSAAQRLNSLGYEVTVFEKNANAGGLLRYGIPNFKLNKYLVSRRTQLMEAEGVKFEFNSEFSDYSDYSDFDAIVIATGTPTARDLNVPGRDLEGVHFALEILSQQNRLLTGEDISGEKRISAEGKKVLVIGGGDTGSDCIGTSHRQGATSVTQIEIMPKPPVGHNPDTPWPWWPVVLKTTTSHEEGCERRWCLTTNRFIDDGNGHVKGAEVEEVEWIAAKDGGRPQMRPTGKKEVIDCDLVLLAMGFLRPEHPQYPANVFIAGDAKSGASLVVRAIASGRQVADDVDKFLKENK